MIPEQVFQQIGGTTGSFIVEIDGVPVGRFSECQGLEVELEVETYEEGGTNGFVHQLPGRIRYPNIVLKRGITRDNDVFDWFNSASGATFVAEGKVRREPVAITMIGRNGDRLRSWTLIDAMPVKWTGPSFANTEDGVPTEELEVTHHGFEAATFD